MLHWTIVANDKNVVDIVVGIVVAAAAVVAIGIESLSAPADDVAMTIVLAFGYVCCWISTIQLKNSLHNTFLFYECLLIFVIFLLLLLL